MRRMYSTVSSTRTIVKEAAKKVHYVLIPISAQPESKYRMKRNVNLTKRNLTQIRNLAKHAKTVETQFSCFFALCTRTSGNSKFWREASSNYYKYGVPTYRIYDSLSPELSSNLHGCKRLPNLTFF